MRRLYRTVRLDVPTGTGLEGTESVGEHHVDVTVEAQAAPAAVYALLRDGATWPQWGRWDSFELERPGTDEPEGVGAIRVWHVGRKRIREEIVELIPDRRFGYTLLS